MEISGYKIEKQIGKGGMAKVYLATHEGLNRQVAIKVMNRQLDDDGNDNNFSDRFIREARIVASLTHQNIVTIYDVGLSDGHHYIAMEYLPGGVTLDHKLKKGMSKKEGLETIKQIGSALGFAHSNGIIHRDVKPENILFRGDGTAVLTDFGIAKASASETKMTATGMVIGTPTYMSPEQAQGFDIGPFSDIYSLGVVFYEILTGKVPYSAESTIAIVFKHISDPVPILPDDKKEYQPVLERMMSKTLEGRYKSCEQMIEDIDNLLSGGAANNATMINSSFNDGTAVNQAVVAGKKENTEVDETLLIEKEKKSKTGLIISLVVVFAVIAGGGVYYVNETQQQEKLALQKKQRESKLKLANEKKLKVENEKRIATAKELKKKEELTLAQSRIDAENKSKEVKAKTKSKAPVLSAKKSQNRKKINALLQTANKQVLSSQFNKAYLNYKEVLKLDGRNRSAKNGVTRIANRYLTLANTAAVQYKFEKANKYVNSVIKIDPTNEKLFKTQEKIFELKQQQLTKQLESKRLAEELKRNRQLETQTKEIIVKEPEKKRRSYGGF